MSARAESSKHSSEMTDKQIIDGIIPLVQGICMVFGSNCGVSLYVKDKDRFVCIAAENGDLIERKVGASASGFLLDMIRDESHAGGKDVVGIYYTKTAEGHALKNVTNLIRNGTGEVIGCLCIAIDLSVPLHEFIRGFIPVVDNDLANSLAEPLGAYGAAASNDSPGDISAFIHNALEQEISTSNEVRSISPTERNKLIVKELDNRGIFKIRGSTGIVAQELGVSRYTIYNYLKYFADDISGDD